MRDISSICIASAALALVSSAALAEQTGTVTRIDRLNGTIAVSEAPVGTIGASGSTATAKNYKVQGVSLDALHAGDQVTFSASQNGGVDTITKIEKKK